MGTGLRKISQITGPLLGVTLFGGALYVLSVQLREYKLDDVLKSFRSIPQEQVLVSALFCVLSYIVLTLYDVLAIRYVGERLRYYRIAIASFVGYTFSHNLGFSVITGGAARYRLFSCWGLKAEQIAQAIAFSGITFWFGFSLLGGFIFLFDPPRLPQSVIEFELPYRPLGAVLLVACFCYVYFWSVKGRALRVKAWQFPPPPPRITLLGLIVSAIDWLLAAAVTYALLPPGVVPFWQFVGVFQAAQVLAMISHVPGGIGIFESLVIAFYSETLPAGELLGILLAYRVIYYLIPLLISFLLFFARELQVNWHQIRPILGGVTARSSRGFPGPSSTLAFGCGMIAIVAGGLSPVTSGFEQVVTGLLGLTGSLLLLVSRPLSRRIRSAWRISLYLFFITGCCAVLLENFELLLPLGVALLFLPFRNAYLRLRSFSFREWLSPASLGAMVSVILGAAWLSYLAHGKFYPETILASAATVVMIFIKWILTGKTSLAEQVIPRSAALSPLVLRQESFYHLPSKGGGTAIDFIQSEGFLIALGDPVGDGQDMEVLWSLRALAEERGEDLVYYNCSDANLESFIGCEVVKIGSDAVVELSKFFLERSAGAGVLEREGLDYPASVAQILSSYLLGKSRITFSAGEKELKIQDVRELTREALESFLVWAKSQGFTSVNLGLVPLIEHDTGSSWTCTNLRHYPLGESFPSLQELRDFAARYATVYRPRFMVVAAPERLADSMALLEKLP